MSRRVISSIIFKLLVGSFSQIDRTIDAINIPKWVNASGSEALKLLIALVNSEIKIINKAFIIIGRDKICYQRKNLPCMFVAFFAVCSALFSPDDEVLCVNESAAASEDALLLRTGEIGAIFI